MDYHRWSDVVPSDYEPARHCNLSGIKTGWARWPVRRWFYLDAAESVSRNQEVQQGLDSFCDRESGDNIFGHVCACEYQGLNTSQNTATGVNLLPFLANYSNGFSTNLAPDLLAKVAFEPRWGHFEIKALGRFFRDRAASTGTTNGNTNTPKAMPFVSAC
jgi:hypothetical protein